MKKTSKTEIINWLNALHHGIEMGEPLGQIFIKPYHLLTLAIELKRHHCRHLEMPEQLQHYASLMSLWEAADIEAPEQVHSAHARGRFLPVQALTSRSKLVHSADELTTILSTQSAENSTLDSLNTALQELLDNYYSHARVDHDLYGLACAQTWPKGHLAQIAVVEGGLGIRESSSENPLLVDQLETENACELATRLGVTSKPGQGHAGYGLALTRNLMRLNGGTISLLSGNEGFIEQAGQFISFDLPQSWQGTLLIIEWQTDRPLDCQAVYKSWPLPEGMGDDDFT